MKSPTKLFIEAEQFCVNNGFKQEIDWCENRPKFESVNAQVFLCEYAWVVYNSGMKNSVIENMWNDLTEAFLFFDAEKVIGKENSVKENVLKLFGHKKKLEAILKVAKMMVHPSYEALKKKVKDNPLEELDKLPFIGPVTKYHLARNLGFDFIKPDRHLVRLALKYNMSAFSFCKVIHEKTGRRLGVIDVILWRFMEQNGQRKLSQG